MLKPVRRTGIALALVTGLALASACTPGKDDAPARTDDKPAVTAAGVPARALVVWTDTMCATTATLDETRKVSARKIEELLHPTSDPASAHTSALEGVDSDPAPGPAYRPDPGFTADSYLKWASSSVEAVAAGYAGLRPSGIPAADRLRARLAAGVGEIRPEVTRLSDYFALTSLSPAERTERAKRVGALLTSVRQPRPDLAALADTHQDLAAAYHLAPRCVPSPAPVRPVRPVRPADPSASPEPSRTPAPVRSQAPAELPPAADGTDFAACADGRCEVRLTTDPADIRIGDLTLTAWVRNRVVRLHTAYPSGGSGSMTLGEGGRGSYGRAGGTTVTVTVKLLRADEANVDIATARS
ncbi:hypothetical protein [Streptomyces liangshanensis]|uniref:LigA protein n=1 Tax=Streptomyces liangshanensis TaxID=2717324 RepID=A0A6G9GZK0_9ACTN|nr:hypothetical protein [Streptomyces liangshanensis]QIQ03712.1 hypothetical protein HA039_16505 [Streptomyces liangshanensis]